jgi:ElaB/YqjD/DUF883 family membrane-anchored ribosome-binding protein
MSKIKLYDKKDLDYYNPKPYLLGMLSIFNEQDYIRLKNWISNDLSHIVENNKIKDGIIDTLSVNDLDRVISECESVLNRKASNIEDEIINLELKIKRVESEIETTLISKAEYIAELEGLKNVVARYTKPNN